MTIKEFSQKHSLVFFWTTVVLLILNIIMTCGAARFERYDYDYERGGMMRGENRGFYNKEGYRNKRYNEQAPVNTGNVIQATGTANTAPTNQ